MHLLQSDLHRPPLIKTSFPFFSRPKALFYTGGPMLGPMASPRPKSLQTLAGRFVIRKVNWKLSQVINEVDQPDVNAS
ncbi:hypothetical protein CEXT_661541 [Caerostris extrusa]|uniref:Uncharacterized protein n=1 Tax=Caerostris extrusa TaxID=172846 RepID=A0AAV4PLK0_CAEEX|nr:hypothetical protein CEXT_661541 [Caerostris extrusa]